VNTEMKTISAAVAVVVLSALAVAFVAWNRSAPAATCDEDALAVAIERGIGSAEHGGIDVVAVGMPVHCAGDDVGVVLPRVSRSWHAMPDGTIMRQGTHTR
jgi:uncharacterized membrane protein